MLYRSWVLAVALAVSAAGCSSGSQTPSSVASGLVTQTFIGTLQGGTNAIHLFTVTKTGIVSVTITQTTVPAGLMLAAGIGSPLANGACLNITSANPPIQPSAQPQLTASLTAGAYCLELGLFQLPNPLVQAAPASASASYTVSVAHT